MRYIIIAIFLCSTAYGQTIINGVTPAGVTKAYMPGITIAGSATLTTIYADTLAPSTLVAGRVYEFNIFCSLTTAVSLLPTITTTLSIGSTSLPIISSSLLSASLTNRPFRIHVMIFANTDNNQYAYAEIFSDGGTLGLTQAYVPKRMIATEDMAVSKIIKVTAQLSSAVGLAGTTLYIDNVYKNPF